MTNAGLASVSVRSEVPDAARVLTGLSTAGTGIGEGGGEATWPQAVVAKTMKSAVRISELPMSPTKCTANNTEVVSRTLQA